MQIRKICIKSIAVFMAAIVMVSTPLSRFADTEGVSESHAVAPALITLGGLFGAIAGAYGLYVAVDKLGDYAENWFDWTADNATDARSDLQKIKDGVTGYVISKAVTKSVADYLSNVVAEPITINSYGRVFARDSLPSDVITNSFVDYILNDYFPTLTGENLLLDIEYIEKDNGSSNYRITYLNPTASNGVLTARQMERYDSELLYLTPDTYYGPTTYVWNYTAFDSDGVPIYHLKNYGTKELCVYKNFKLGSDATWQNSATWQQWAPDIANKEYCRTFNAYYVCDTAINGSQLSKDDILSHAVNSHSFVIDYKTHGNNALDNTNALDGAEVTQAQLEAIQQAVEKEYSNVVQFPNSGGDNEEDNNPSNLDNAMFTALIANAVAQAVANTLKDMGYIKNPTDEPSGENVKEQLGNIQISLDGLIDAISQINPAQGLANIAQGIAELPQKITASVTDAIRNVFEDLFVPDEGAIQDKVDEITDKFAFADSLLTVVDDIDGALKNASGPPEIYIHFEDAEDSKYTPIGTLKLLSFEWYERYKPYGDALLSSMLWLFFLWKVRKRIAEIVQGLSVSGESDANASANSAIGIERGRSS